ncbi:MAG: response regulator [Polyangiaceae bacterium]
MKSSTGRDAERGFFARDVLLGEIARKFAGHDINAAIEATLEALGAIHGIEHATLYRLTLDRRVYLAAGWRADHGEIQGLGMPPVPFRTGGLGLDRLLRGETVSIERLDEIPDDDERTWAWVKKEGIRSAVSVPLVNQGVMTGWLTAATLSSERTWTHEEVSSLRLIAEIVAVGVARADAEEARSVSEVRFRRMVQNASDIISVLDANGVALYVSPAIEKITGFRESEILGRTGFGEVHPEDVPAMQAGLGRLVQTPGMVSGPVVFRFKHRAGHWIHLENVSTNLLADPAVRGVVIITRDVSERVRTSRELGAQIRREELIARCSRRLLDADFDDALKDVLAWLGGLIEVDTLSAYSVSTDGRLLVPVHEWRAPGVSLNSFRNEPITVVRGHEDHEFNHWAVDTAPDWRISDIESYPPEYSIARDRFRNSGTRSAIGVIAQTNGEVIGAMVARMSNAARVWLEEDARLLAIVGELIAVGFVRHRAQAHLTRAKEIAESASETKSVFLAHMSHELRTPLNGVIGMIELLSRTPLVDRQRRFVEMARSSANHLLSVVNDILDFSKIEAGKLELEHISFVPADVIEETVASCALTAEERRLDLVCRIAPELANPSMGDPTRLRQILVNLIGNALKFTEQGEVSVEGRVTHDDAGSPLLFVEVKDTGVGMSKSALDGLFTPFNQIDTSTTRRFGGSGLGLVISRQLIERMGGKIGVESELGKGSRFWFTVRLDRCESLQEEPSQRASFAGYRTLVVDDNATNRTILEEYLSAQGMICEAVYDGPSAIVRLREMAASRPFHLAIVDMNMPGMDGLSVARLVRADPSIATTKLILLGSLGQPIDPDIHAALRLEGVANKPVLRRDLLRIVRQALGAGREDAPARSRGELRDNHREERRPRHVLVVEDSDINAEVVGGLLATAGHTFERVTDGMAAVEAVLTGRFDVVLMDCQLPVMDGFEATSRIRILERNGRLSSQRGGAIPIIALTAGATTDDQRRCSEAGMTAFITTPIDATRLIQAIETPARAATTSSASGSMPAMRAVADLEAALGRLRGNRSLLHKVIQGFLAGLEERMTRFRVAVSTRDSAAVVFESHRLNGQVATFNASRSSDAISAIKHAADAGDWSVATTNLAALERELSLLCETLSFALSTSERESS